MHRVAGGQCPLACTGGGSWKTTRRAVADTWFAWRCLLVRRWLRLRGWWGQIDVERAFFWVPPLAVC